MVTTTTLSGWRRAVSEACALLWLVQEASRATAMRHTKRNRTIPRGMDALLIFIKQDDRRDKWLKLDSRGDLHHPVSTALKESTKALVSDRVVVDSGERSL